MCPAAVTVSRAGSPATCWENEPSTAPDSVSVIVPLTVVPPPVDTGAGVTGVGLRLLTELPPHPAASAASTSTAADGVARRRRRQPVPRCSRCSIVRPLDSLSTSLQKSRLDDSASGAAVCGCGLSVAATRYPAKG